MASAAPGTDQIVATLEAVLAHDPLHPGANHYYVHTLEASPHPEKALPSAERLRAMMPAAGHLVHMPAHIMQRVGRYEEAAEANRRGAAADQTYVGLTRPLDYYMMYNAHNYQFLAASAAMEGRRAETVEAVDSARRVIPDEMLMGMPGADWYLAESYTARVRFGLWDEILAMAPPNAKFSSAHRRLPVRARPVAGGPQSSREARATLAQLQGIIASLPADSPAANNTARDVLGIGALIVQARLAAAEGQSDSAVKLLQQAVQAEDKLAYNEPKDWFFPVRHLLGAQLMHDNKASEAEAVYREDLKLNPGNGWALYGLSAALKSQGKAKEASEYAQQFAAAWKRADVTLTASAY